jgi:ABC-type transporter Mla MlaB component
MANKKTSKNVIDYDPLAWLNEESDLSGSSDENSAPAENEPEAVAAPKKKTVKKKIAKKKTAKKKGASKQTANKKTADKIVSAKKVDEPLQKSTPMETEADQNTAWGFFDDEQIEHNQPESEPETVESEPAAFGFFSDDDTPEPAAVNTEQSVEVTADDTQDDAGYGFFDTDESLTTQAAQMDADSNIIYLGADLTIRSVAACKMLIEQNLSSGFDIRLAAGELQKIDSAGLQLLYSLKMTLQKTSQTIYWESTSSIINNAAKMIGMPALCDADEESDPGYGFFSEDENPGATSDTQADDGYGFF